MNLLSFAIIYRTITFVIGDKSSFKNLVLDSAFKDQEKSESLARLLFNIVLEYNFKECALGIIYDDNYKEDTIGRRSFVDYLLENSDSYLSIKQERLNATATWTTYENQEKEETCTNYVLFVETTLSMDRLMAARNSTGKIIVVTSETPWEVKDFLKDTVSRAYVQLLVVAHSLSQRTPVKYYGDGVKYAYSGTYLLYTHSLFVEGSGTNEPLLLASWLNNSITVENVDLFPDKMKNGFMGHRLLTTVVENPPFTIKRSSENSDEFNWDGLEIKILRLAASQLNITVEFVEPHSSAISPVESAKNDLLRGTSAAVIGGIYQTQELSELFDLSVVPHAQDCASFISLASTALPKYRAILGPFQLSVWILLCLSYFILIIPLSFNSNYTILNLIKHPRGLNHMFWFVFSTYTNSFVVKNPLLDHGMAKNSISMLLGIYWVFTIIITACYTGSIVSFITLPTYPTAMDTAKDLLNNRYRIGTLDHNGWEKWFNVNTTDDPFVKKLFRKMEYVPSLMEGVTNASRAYFWPYAFLASKTSLEYLIQTDFAPTWTTKRSLMHISDECFVRYNIVKLFPTKSLYAKSISKFLLRATETGLIDRINADVDWQVQRIAMKTNKQITKTMSQKIQVTERNLTAEDTLGMFLLLGIGYLFALIVLSLESLAGLRKKRKTDQFGAAIQPANFDATQSYYRHRIKRMSISARKSV